MLFLLFLACKEPEVTQVNVCEQEVSVTDVAIGLTEEQKEISYAIEQEFNEMDIPQNITAAAIVNALAESHLNTDAVGDGGKSVGAFQLHKNGLGKRLSIDDRKNIYTSSNIIGIQILKNDKLFKLEQNNNNISLLTQVITEDIMRPSNIEEEKKARSRLATQIFPNRI